MAYRSRYIPVNDLIIGIAETATGGDIDAAEVDFLRAAQDGTLEVSGTEMRFLGEHGIIPRGHWFQGRLRRYGGPYDDLLPSERPSWVLEDLGIASRQNLEARREDAERIWPHAYPEGNGALKPAPKYDLHALRKEYLEEEKAAGRTGSQNGFVEYARKNGASKEKRNDLRTFLKQGMSQRGPGRPRGSARI